MSREIRVGIVSLIMCCYIALTSSAQDPPCYYGQVWSDCGTACDATCDDPYPVCMTVCVAKCVCPSDKPIFHTWRMECITQQQCYQQPTTMYPGANDNRGWSADCPSGWYGSMCDTPCSSGCLYGSCDKVMGYCASGCTNNTQGTFCDEQCTPGCRDMYGDCERVWGINHCASYMQCSICGCQGAGCISGNDMLLKAAAPRHDPPSMVAVLLFVIAAALWDNI